jgi:hypothetical protein
LTSLESEVFKKYLAPTGEPVDRVPGKYSLEEISSCIHHGVVFAMATSRRYGGLDGEGRRPVALIGLHSLWAVYNFTLTFWGRP